MTRRRAIQEPWTRAAGRRSVIMPSPIAQTTPTLPTRMDSTVSDASTTGSIEDVDVVIGGGRAGSTATTLHEGNP